jgi:hypothetical protein
MAQEAAQFAQNNPKAVAAFITNHFFNSQVQTVLYLPGTWRLPRQCHRIFRSKRFRKISGKNAVRLITSSGACLSGSSGMEPYRGNHFFSY